MRLTMLVRSCALALSLFHLAMIVSLFVPSLGPASEDRLVPESLLQVFFAQYAEVRTPAPAITAGFLVLPLLLPPLASWAACRSPVRMRSLLPLGSCLPLLLVGLLFWLMGRTDDPERLVVRLGFALSFLLTLVETISLPLLLRSQEQARLVNHSGHLPSAQDKPARGSDPCEGEIWEHTGTRRALPSLVLSITLVLLCYLLIFLSLFFPYLKTSGGYAPVSFQTTGWQLSGEWLGCTTGVSFLVLLFLLALSQVVRMSFTPIQKQSLLFRSIALNHLFNLLGFLSSSLLLIFSLGFVGDLDGPFQSVDAAFGIPPAAFLLASIGSGLLLDRVSLIAEVTSHDRLEG